ncbi:MAG: hypothetical protein ABIL86_06320 [candidate division WOR-3 bacterium]
MAVFINVMGIVYLAVGLLPLETDKVLMKGTGKIEESGSYTIQFSLPETKNGLFLNIEELPSFKVYINGSFFLNSTIKIE